MQIENNKSVHVIIAALVLLLVALCVFVPGFAGAVWDVLYCSFAPVACVKVIPDPACAGVEQPSETSPWFSPRARGDWKGDNSVLENLSRPD